MWKNKNKPDFGLLSDLKVVSASSSLAGPFIATIFGEYGADVVWVENADMPDFTRGTPNWQCEGERRNCRNIALKLRHPMGREALLRLIEDADIFIESSKGGQFDKLDMSDEVLWERNPKLVIGHVSGFGQTGIPDYVKRPSFDAIGQAFSGYMNENRNPMTPPYAVGQFASDYTTALYTAIALLAAWHHARETGEGESIDATQYEYMMRTSIYSIDWFTNHRTFPTAGEQNVNAGWGTYECKDGYIFCCFNGSGVMKRGNELLGCLTVMMCSPKARPPGASRSPAAKFSSKPLKSGWRTAPWKRQSRSCSSTTSPYPGLILGPMWRQTPTCRLAKTLWSGNL